MTKSSRATPLFGESDALVRRWAGHPWLSKYPNDTDMRRMLAKLLERREHAKRGGYEDLQVRQAERMLDGKPSVEEPDAPLSLRDRILEFLFGWLMP